jgi:SAM-dependent methyltransferase
VSFADHFSTVAPAYARHRPCYSPSWFAHLAGLCTHHDCAWDCATGTGQAALGLVPHFHQVIASDASAEQIAQAPAHPQIDYRVFPAEAADLGDRSVDLITVAQAYHWFDPEAFFQEVRRVARPAAIIAVWGYGLSQVNPALDAVMQQLYADWLGSYWPPERWHVHHHYRTLPFPFAQIPFPEATMTAAWSIDDLLAYLRTWSGVQRYQATKGEDPVALLEPEFRRAWGSTAVQTVRWPLFGYLGKIES